MRVTVNQKSDYKQLCLQIVNQWKQENIKLSPGATEQELGAFEAIYGIKLPEDFRYLYSLVNGTIDWDTDKYLFCLWPLSRILEDSSAVVINPFEISPAIEITFGDYMIDARRYYLAANSQSAYFVKIQEMEKINGEKINVSLNNFTDFLICYLTDPAEIYLWE